MTFTRLVLHNFGAYRGEHAFEFDATSRKRPIVLIGGLNGAGKSTIMDAIQLALFGKLARCTGRADLPYEEFLRRAVHRLAIPQEARLQLEFVSHSAGQRTVYTLDRSWSCKDQRVREHFEVRRNNVPDRLLSESWLEHVDQWLPNTLSQIFFFDGEQLEALADATTSAAVLRSSVEALLGLDLVTRLSTDLSILERRKDNIVLSSGAREELEALERRKLSLTETRSKVRQELGAAQNALDECLRDLQEVDSRIAKDGGQHFDRRHELEAQHTRLENDLRSIEDEFRELADGPAPLLLVRNLLEGVFGQATHEQAALQAALVDRLLTERDTWVIDVLQKAGVSKKILSRTTEYLVNDREDRISSAAVESYIRLPSEARDVIAALRQEVLDRTGVRATALSHSWNQATDAIEASTRVLAAIPSPEAIAHLITTRDERRVALRAAEARFETVKQALGRLDNEDLQIDLEIARYRRTHRERTRESEDALRAIDHIGRVQSTLTQFRSSLLKRHAGRIEELALDSLRQLLRKEKLVQDLRLDPDTFAVSLKGSEGRTIPVERLSAGERQLLATALLWGLRRAAGRVIPLVIDTPLGRLDSSHRMHLVTRYFPHASHQTILLSTDEEISGPYYQALKPWVAAEYTISVDEAAESAIVAAGYFSASREPASVA